MYQGQTVFSQPMEFLPRHTFRKCVNRYQGNYFVKQDQLILKLSCRRPSEKNDPLANARPVMSQHQTLDFLISNASLLNFIKRCNQ
jgi:hypothetical protein